MNIIEELNLLKTFLNIILLIFKFNKLFFEKILIEPYVSVYDKRSISAWFIESESN